MAKIFSMALFASSAAAITTASFWMPGMEDTDMTYEGAIVNVDNDRTTLSLDVQAATVEDSMADVPATITVGGNTYYGFEAAASAYGVTVTISGECSRQNTDEKEATCTMTTKGLEDAMSSVCADPEYASDLCPDGADAALSTSMVLPEGYFNMIPVVVTNSDYALPSASAAASVSAGSASVTASRSAVTSVASGSATATNSDSESAASSGASPTSSSLEQATGAAQMIPVPALAGLGAAVAAFFL